MKRLYILLIICQTLNVLPADYTPIPVNGSWDYDILDTNDIDMGEYSISIIKDTIVNSNIYKKLQLMLYDSVGIDTVMYVHFLDSNNDIYRVDDLSNPYSIIKIGQHKYNDGDKWLNDNNDTIWITYYGYISVPAGNFDSCFAAHSDIPTVDIFAPGVGLVKSYVGLNRIFVLKSYDVSIDIMPNISNNIDMRNINILPNPFYHSTIISINPLNYDNIKLCIYDCTGKLIIKLEDLKESNILWNSENNSPGIYFVKLFTDDNIYSRKMTLLK